MILDYQLMSKVIYKIIFFISIFLLLKWINRKEYKFQTKIASNYVTLANFLYATGMLSGLAFIPDWTKLFLIGGRLINVYYFLFILCFLGPILIALFLFHYALKIDASNGSKPKNNDGLDVK